MKSVFRDLTAGLTVALVALPLAIGFGVASGAGAAAGIATAIVAGVVAAAFGGSRYQVSGPTGAMTVVLIPLAASYGIPAVLLVGFGSGLLLVLAALAGMGRHVHKLPTALIDGFTAGIALVIALQQVPAGLGHKASGSESILASAFTSIDAFVKNPHPLAIAMTVAVAAVLVTAPRFWPRLPLSLIAVVLATAANSALQLNLATVGELPRFGSVSAGFFDALPQWQSLIVPTISVALLGALESLLSAKIADRMKPETPPHDSNRELLGQGLANLAVPFFGGIPATAALARTAVNVRAGAVTRFSSVAHALLLAAFVLLAGPVVSQVPIPALSGVLIATAAHMVKPSELFAVARRSRLDAIVLSATLAVTVLSNLTAAVVVGLLLFMGLRKTRLSKQAPMVDQNETLGD